MPTSRTRAELLDLRALPGPIAGFAGNLTAEKVDFELVEAIARLRPDWSVVLVGPVAGNARREVEGLSRIPNVHALGFRAYGELSAYVSAFSVGLIPYRANDYTRNCSPLKVFEYLAAGKAVVASGVPELGGMSLT